MCHKAQDASSKTTIMIHLKWKLYTKQPIQYATITNEAIFRSLKIHKSGLQRSQRELKLQSFDKMELYKVWWIYLQWTHTHRWGERERESTNINCHAVMLQKLLDTLRPPEVLLSNCLLSSGFSHPPKNQDLNILWLNGDLDTVS